jgi:hypothetical protein
MNLKTVVVSACALLSLAEFAHAQTIGTWTPQSPRVNSDYTPNTSGSCVMGRNRDGKCLNFSVVRDDGTRRVIPMADPTVLVIPDSTGAAVAYVAGTSDWARDANFCIYKSKDLIHWDPHATAFRDDHRLARFNEQGAFPAYPNDTLKVQPDNSRPGGDLLGLGTGDYTFSMYDMWAPELYIDPAYPGRVTLSFTAKVLYDSSAITPYTTPVYPPVTSPTVYATSVPIEEFTKDYTIGSKVYFGDIPGSIVQPYVYNNGGFSSWDGGSQMGYPIPVTGYGYYTDSFQQPGTASWIANSYLSHWGVNDARTWMGLDSFVYFEGGRPWMLYAYAPAMTSSLYLSQVTAHPMTNNAGDPWWFRLRCMDPSPASGFVDIARATNPYNRPDAVDGSPTEPGSVLNGSLNEHAQNTPTAIAEGPAVFSRPTVGANPVPYTYALYSRNNTLSPAYGIYYRKSDQGMAGLALPGNEPQELILVQSARRMLPGGVSFGHGEVFKFFNGRYYLVFHMKETSPDGSFPLTTYGARTVFFKELTFNETTGEIMPLSCDQTIPAFDVNVFLAPLPTGAPPDMTAIVGSD